MDIYRNILILLSLLLISGFFSASETALTSFKSTNLEYVENKKTESLLRKWLKSPNEMLTGILLGNNIVNILSSSLATAIIIDIFGDSTKSLAIVTIVMTVLILIFGEITPKIVAKNYYGKLSTVVIRPIYYFGILMKPIIKSLMWISILIGRIFGIEIKNENIVITQEDLISIVNVGEAEGIIEEQEKEMIKSIVGLGETHAKEVMTPRTSVFAVEGNKTLNETLEEIIDVGFSRIPVYEETIDNIIGMLYVKDILIHLKEKSIETKVKDLIREVYYVPETKPIIKILQEFKTEQIHIAVVLDEYGGFSGLLTIEDLLEEIVGEIRDEYDTEEEEGINEIEKNRYIVDAMLDIETINKDLNIDLPLSEDYESLGGLIMSKLGKIPEQEDELEIDDIKIKVIEVEKRRVIKVEINKGE